MHARKQVGSLFWQPVCNSDVLYADTPRHRSVPFLRVSWCEEQHAPFSVWHHIAWCKPDAHTQVTCSPSTRKRSSSRCPC
jgi:hypothetical protein